MTAQEVKQLLLGELRAVPKMPFISLLMPMYGIEQDSEVALTAPPIEKLFTEAEFEAMAQDATLLEQAREDLRNYQENHYWDGYVQDARSAYVCGTHDFNGTRRTFQQFRADQQKWSLRKAQGGK